MSNVKVTNGKTLEMGFAKSSVAACLPGIGDNVQADELKELLGDTIVFTANAKGYRGGTIYTMITPDVFEKLDKKLLKRLDMDKSIKKLDTASHQLIDGTTQLSDGVDLLATSYPRLTEGTAQLKAGTNSLTLKEALNIIMDANEKSGINRTKIEELESSANEALEALRELAETKNKLQQENDELREITNESAPYLSTDLNTRLENKITEINNTVSEIDEKITGLQEANAALLEKIDLLTENSEVLANDIILTQDALRVVDIIMNGGDYDEIMAEVETLEKDFYDITGETIDIKSMVLELAYDELGENMGKIESISELLDKADSGVAQLDDGAKALNKGSKQVQSGINKLNKGSTKLQKGMTKYYKQGISKIIKAYNKYAAGLAKALKQAKKAPAQFNNVTGLPDGMTGHVSFVYTTEIGVSASDKLFSKLEE